jgi:hypothetical protein
MSLARNIVGAEAAGFLNEWIWVAPTCAKDRCATSDWDGVMHMPIAHGEGRFTTKDKDLIDELKENDQIAFSYCDSEGNVSDDPIVTPNGSMYAIAGICNPVGNVVALMPHPERTTNGDPYFQSLQRWLSAGMLTRTIYNKGGDPGASASMNVEVRTPKETEIFIDTIITNNEERTVEQAARVIASSLTLKQLRYLSIGSKSPGDVLSTISIFNPNKEVAYVRRNGDMKKWNSDTKSEESLDVNPLDGTAFLRRDEPDTGAGSIGPGAETGVCYVCTGVGESDLASPRVLEIFANPHASTLERLS